MEPDLRIYRSHIWALSLICRHGAPIFLPMIQSIGKTPASVSAVSKELAQHPPHTLFDMWNLFFDHPKCVLGTLSPNGVVTIFLQPVTHVTYPKYNFKNKIMKHNSVHSVYSNDKTNYT